MTSLIQLVLACPSCAGRDNGGIFAGVFIGGMIFLPFLVAGIVYLVIRRGGFGNDDSDTCR